MNDVSGVHAKAMAGWFGRASESKPLQKPSCGGEGADATGGWGDAARCKRGQPLCKAYQISAIQRDGSWAHIALVWTMTCSAEGSALANGCKRLQTRDVAEEGACRVPVWQTDEVEL